MSQTRLLAFPWKCKSLWQLWCFHVILRNQEYEQNKSHLFKVFRSTLLYQHYHTVVISFIIPQCSKYYNWFLCSALTSLVYALNVLAHVTDTVSTEKLKHFDLMRNKIT